jgi:predicted ATPase
MLVQQQGELVQREELRWALWPDGTVVDFEHGLNTAIKRLRDVLGDSAAGPQFIETVPRRGYRFIGTTESAGTPLTSAQTTQIVGREQELQLLKKCLSRALQGIRQCAFVTGEVGIGKTALVQQFLREAATSMPLCIGEGHAMERYRGDDVYGPMIEALQGLARTHVPLVGVIGRNAPTWIPHLPSIADRTAAYVSGEMITNATRSRMLREMVATLETATELRPLLIILEDLHWADESTIELIAALARRNGPTRLMLLCTYRPVGTGGFELHVHRIKQELRVHGRCVEIALAGVNVHAIKEYLDLCFPGLISPKAFPEALHSRTDGNPLFIINCMEALVGEDKIADLDGVPRVLCDAQTAKEILPRSLTALVRLHLQRLSAGDQRILEVASVIGSEFTVAPLANVTGTDSATVEAALERLARSGDFVERWGVHELPDQSVTGAYRFTHALYSQVLYENIPPERIAILHRKVGLAIEIRPDIIRRRTPRH